MMKEARGDVWKVWFYAAASVALGAWSSPLFYNAGKALAEVSAGKTTNNLLKKLAGICREADFQDFYRAAILLVAAALFFPWMEWLHARRGDPPPAGGPWKVRLPDGARNSPQGQPLRSYPRGLWHVCAGFLLMAGLLLPMGVALVPSGFVTLRSPAEGMAVLAVKTLAGVMVWAALMEVFFRGIAMGVFLRAMRPATAIGMSAAFFALALSAIPAPGVTVADPDSWGAGLELLKRVTASFADWRYVIGDFAPLLALGSVLAYARWRTKSLWLPIGLHAGWLFSKNMLAALSDSTFSLLTVGGLFQQGLIPLAAVVFAGVLAHYLTANHNHERAVRS